MPIIKSAKKKVRQAKKHYEANKVLKGFLKNLKKKTFLDIGGGKMSASDAKKTVDYFKSQMDKAWSKGIYKRNKSSRLKSKIDLLYTKQFSQPK